MKELFSLPATGDIWAEYDDVAAACRALGCDGLELVWGGGDLPADVPQALHIGYHLTFWPDWLDFWNNDRAALARKFGAEAVWTAFYGGPAGRETLLKGYRADLERAVAWGAEYVVFHVSDVSPEEGYTYRWEHTSAAVLAAAAEVANLLLDGGDHRFAFLVENLWWPGFTFTRPAETGQLLDAIHYENKGIMLDMGHLMNTNLDLTTQTDGAAYVHKMLDEHGVLCQSIRGVHLHQSVSGAYVKAHMGPPPLGWAHIDYLQKYGAGYRHVQQIDAHRPWSDPAIVSVLDRIGPNYLVHELSAPNRAQRDRQIQLQRAVLARGRR